RSNIQYSKGQISASRATPDQFNCRFDRGLTVGPRIEGRGRDLELTAVKAPAAKNARHRLAGKASGDELVHLLQLGRTNRHFRSADELMGLKAQRRGNQNACITGRRLDSGFAKAPRRFGRNLSNGQGSDARFRYGRKHSLRQANWPDDLL